MNEHHTFRSEVIEKYDEAVYELFQSCFEALPLAASVCSDYLCVHGGISPDLQMLDDINKIDRFVEPEPSGFLCDILWSDPHDEKEARTKKFTFNSKR